MNLNYFALAMLLTQIGIGAPEGYRFPNEADYSGDWKTFRSAMPTPFVVKADFNGDAMPDESWLLPASSGAGWGLFVFVGSSSGPHRVVPLGTARETPIQAWAIGSVEPGQHKTACGKGYWKCERDEPEVLQLKLPALRLSMLEGASSMFWWDARTASFQRTWTSD